MNKDMLVEIFVSFGTEEGKIATGYPVAPNRILTARHSLHPEGSDVAGNIEVRWHYLHKNKLRAEYNWCLANIVDCGLDDALDVALLEYQFPEGVDSDCRLESDNPEKELDWESEGFARAGKREGDRPAIPLGGKAYSVANYSDWLVLTERGKASKEELWCGVSGSPVFMVNSRTIIGVTTECPKNYDAARLNAIPTWKLLQCEGFRNEIGYDIHEKQKERTRKNIENILSKSAKASKRLSDRLTDKSDGANLPTILINLPVVKLLELCHGAITELLECDEPNAAFIVQQLVYLLTPIIFDQKIINVVRSKSPHGICRVSVATTTVAEIIMAGMDERSVDFMPHDNPRDDLIGKNNLHSQLNCGIDGGKLKAEEVTSHLIEKYAGLSEQTKAQIIGREKLIQDAADELELISKYESRTLYYIYILPVTTPPHQ